MTVEQEQQFTYYWYAARQAVEREQASDALVYLRMCEMLNPYDSRTLTWLGVLMQGLNHHDQARDYYRRAYEAGGNECWANYCQVLLRSQNKRDRREAERIMQQVLKQDPKDEEAWMMLTSCYLLQQNTRKAVKTAGEYVSLDPYNPTMVSLWIELLQATNGSNDDLLMAYDLMVQMRQATPVIFNNYAYLLATSGGDLRQAEAMVMQSLRAEPTNAIYLDTYAWILHLRGSDSEALFYLKRALETAKKETATEIQKHIREIKDAKKKKKK